MIKNQDESGVRARGRNGGEEGRAEIWGHLHDTDGSTTSDLPGDGDPLGVGDDEVGVPSLLGELDTLIDDVALGGGREHVAVLGLANELRHSASEGVE